MITIVGISPMITFFCKVLEPLKKVSPILKKVLLRMANRITIAACDAFIWVRLNLETLIFIASTSAKPEMNPVTNNPLVCNLYKDGKTYILFIGKNKVSCQELN